MAQSEITDAREIVRTEGVLGGDPRIDGTRIGVHHIVPYVLGDKYTVKEVAYMIYTDLSEGDVLAALAYYFEHRDEIETIRERTRQIGANEIATPDDLPSELVPE